MRHLPGRAAALAVAAFLCAAPAAAAPSTADFLVFVTAGTRVDNNQVIRNGGTASIPSLSFKAGILVDNDGGEEATARVRFTLADGLRFGTDVPDPTESCMGTVRTAECQTPLTIGTDPSRRSNGWVWDVVADRAGSYLLTAEILQTSVFDPEPSSNTASATVVVTEPAGVPPPAAPSAGSVKLSPAKPKAGSAFAATVRVSAGGAPVRPTGVACAGSIGGGKLRGTARVAAGSATCLYRPPKSARGKTLRGTVSLTARGTKFTRRFSVRLR